MKKTALLIVDIQQSLVAENPHDCAAFLARCQGLLAAAREHRMTVVHVQHNDPDWEDLRPGSPGWQIHPAVAPLPDEAVFAKDYSSAFRRTGLEAYLRTAGITGLILIGMQTEFCIDTTCRVAFEKEFELVMPEGTNTTFDNGELTAEQIIRQQNSRVFKDRFARVLPLDQVMAEFFPSRTN